MTLAHEFLDFCRSKPADEEYHYCATGSCAFAQFLIATGRATEPCVGSDDWFDEADRPSGDHDIPRELVTPLSRVPETFGALADRLEAALSEQVQS